MKNGKHLHLILRAFSHYISIFMLFAFVITCCMTLFLNVLSAKLGVEFSQSHLLYAKPLTRRKTAADEGCEQNEFFIWATQRAIRISAMLGVK